MEFPPFFVKLLLLELAVLGAVIYSALAVKPQRPGWPRFLSAIPAFVVFGLSPMLVQEVSGIRWMLKPSEREWDQLNKPAARRVSVRAARKLTRAHVDATAREAWRTQ